MDQLDDAQKLVAGFMQEIGLESWVMQVFVVVLVTAVLNLIMRRVFARIHTGLERTETIWDNSTFAALRKPLRAFVWVVGISFAVEIVQRETGAVIFEAVAPIRDVAVVAIIAWFLVSFIREAEQNLVAQKEADGEPLDRTTVDAVSKQLRL